MNEVQLKRENFRLLFSQQQRLNLFQEKRLKILKNLQEENKKIEQQQRIEFAIDQITQLLSDFDSDAFPSQLNDWSRQIIEIVNSITLEIQQVDHIDLKRLQGHFYNIACFMRHNYKSPYFLNMLSFLAECSKKSTVFCHEYCKSSLYAEVLFNLDTLEQQYQYDTIKHTLIIQSYQEHKLPCDYVCQAIRQIIQKVTLEKNLQCQDKEIMALILELFLQIQVEQIEKIKFMQQINQYYLTLFVHLTSYQEIIVQNELLNYIEYLQRNRNYYDSSTIELINQLSFNPKLAIYPDEKALAIAIVGILMSGNSEQTSYYFAKFSSQNFSLDQKLLQNLQYSAYQIKRMTVFAFSNIFGESRLDKCNYFENGTVVQFLHFARQEQSIEVLVEILQALRNLIFNTKDEQFKVLLDNEILSIIIEHDYQELGEQQVTCLLYLIHRLSSFEQIQLQQIVKCNDYFQYFFQNGVFLFVKDLFERTKEPSPELQKLCDIIFSPE